MKHAESAERVRIANERVARCLDKLGVKDKPLFVKHFELPFLGFPYHGKKVSDIRRKTILREILTGNATPRHNEWISRLEQFTDLVKNLK